MALNLSTLKPAKGSNKRKIRVGRGTSSAHGTYSGRGAKGQRARSGGKKGLKLFGLKRAIQSTPKLSGFKSLKPKLQVVNLRDLEKNYEDSDIITPASLWQKGLIGTTQIGVKVLGEGKLTKKFVIKTHKISESAKAMIEKNGGQVIILGQSKIAAPEAAEKTK
jgi:large subunit ribosomal protein L15